MKQKEEIFAEVKEVLDDKELKISHMDDNRPWGGFYVLDESQAADFAKNFFPDINLSDLQITAKLSPKILMVSPNARLSWQYHFRRAEIWKCISESVGVVTSDDDTERIDHVLQKGQIIKLRQGERHRLKGLEDWGVIAEIWQHTDINHPSNEDDIVRLQDDYGR